MLDEQISDVHAAAAMSFLSNTKDGQEALKHVRDNLKGKGILTRLRPAVQRHLEHRQGLRRRAGGIHRRRPG